MGDVAGLVGDALVDGVSTVGSAVADVAVGVATDAAIGGGTVWGVWDGLLRILPSWVFTGGAVALAGEAVFAAFAFFVASGALTKDYDQVLNNAATTTAVLDPFPPPVGTFNVSDNTDQRKSPLGCRNYTTQ